MTTVISIGRLTRDPELRSTANTKAVSDSTLPTNRPVVRDGERVADFINCRGRGKTAENLVKYQTKGNLIAVIGRMQVDNYTDKDGNNRYNTYLLVEELEYLQSKKDNEFKNLNIKTETQQQFDYDSSDLPF